MLPIMPGAMGPMGMAMNLDPAFLNAMAQQMQQSGVLDGSMFGVGKGRTREASSGRDDTSQLTGLTNCAFYAYYRTWT